MPALLTQHEIRRRLGAKAITLKTAGELKPDSTYFFNCQTCPHEWRSELAKVLGAEGGCPNCKKHASLARRGLLLVGVPSTEILSTKEVYTITCERDRRTWDTTVTLALQNGCPACRAVRGIFAGSNNGKPKTVTLPPLPKDWKV